MPNDPAIDTTGITHLAFRETIEHLTAEGHLSMKQRAAVLLRTDHHPVTWQHVAQVLEHIPPAGPCTIRTARTHYTRGVQKVLESLGEVD